MDRKTWSRINELYDAASRLPAEEREAWVRGNTTDERVLSEVLSLLQAPEDDPWSVGAAGASRTPDRGVPSGAWPPIPVPAPADPPPARSLSDARTPTPPALLHRRRASDPKAGGQFASYRLIRESFHDATRLVFEAVSSDGGARPRVALHVLAADAHDQAFAALFHAQGDRLAHLDHPAIPRLVTGGATGDGTAFFVFEHATGEPLDGWCRTRDLNVRGRVNLVLAVCDAVQHANERLVAHGDLRPSNILVSPDARVSVLDTGLASLLGAWAHSAGIETAPHQYMSPEQARGEVLTAASDVYALGVLLYTLLTGYPPYNLAGQTAGRARQLICDTEPDVPSTVVGRRYARTLAGTLDRIILKALRKNPRERYPTAAALAADLCAWGHGHRASVSPATAWSRLGGDGRARRVAVAVLLTVALAAGGALGWQARRLRGERDDARADLASAEARARAAEERAARKPAAADLRLEVAATTSDVAREEQRRGNAVKAEALWTQALADMRPLLDADSSDPRALERTASVHAALASLCRSQRRLDEALAHYREALRARERLATSADAPADAPFARAVAQVAVARLLTDMLEIRPPGPDDAMRLSSAGALLAQAGPVLRDPTSRSQERDEALRELDRQSARLGRLTARRQ